MMRAVQRTPMISDIFFVLLILIFFVLLPLINDKVCAEEIL